KIHVDFDTSGFSGEKTKIVRVYSTDVDNPSQVLTIKGVVSPEVVVEPRSLFFERVLHGSAFDDNRKEVLVRIRDGSKLQITALKSFSKYLVVKETTTAPTQRKLLVGIDPNAPLGELRERLIVELSGGSIGSSVNIPVFAAITGNLQLKPAQLS